MIRRNILLIVLLICCNTVRSQILYQDIYEIKFNVAQEKKLQYAALIILNSDGNNQVRIRCFNNDAKRSTVYELPLITTQTDLKSQRKKFKPALIYGRDSAACIHFAFTFFVPDYFKVLKFSTDGKIQWIQKEKIVDAKLISSRYIRCEDLLPVYIVQYFKPDEKFYNEILNKVSKVQSTPNFYYLVVGNTKDATIGKGCSLDLNNMGFVVKQIANDLNLPFHAAEVSGEKFNKENVLNAITAIKPKPQDIVFFYYSGHGFSFKDDPEHIYPQMDLRSLPPVYSEAVIKSSTKNIEEVFSMIKSKGARLNLVISDCCNSLIEFYRYFPNPNIVPQPYNFPINKEVASLLFLKTKASLLATAASKGQYAVSDETTGGVFTNNFYELLYGNCYDLHLKPTDISWEKILQWTHNNTLTASATYDCGKGIACVQEPVWKVER